MSSQVESTPPKFEIIVDNISEKLEPRDLFCQMDALRHYNDDFVWKEVRRLVIQITKRDLYLNSTVQHLYI